MTSQANLDVEKTLTKGLSMYATAGFVIQQQTDLTICCNGRNLYVHKVILRAQSEFFDKACKPDSPFVESRTGIITLNDEDPILVNFMLSYCYTCEANIGLLKYLPAGKKAASARCKWAETETSEKLMRWVLAYALADKYRVVGLKKAAKKAFHSTLATVYFSGSLSPAFFTRLTHKIYETTPNTDAGLRRLAISYASKNIDSLMSHDSFAESMEKIDGFFVDLMRYNFNTRKRGRRCEVCRRDWNVSFEDELQQDEFKCRRCRNTFTIEQWNPKAPPEKWYDLDDIHSSDEEAENEGRPTKRRRVE
ncbi:hypothetical protein IWX49DRAFT_597016 [Phyllosticta citricarpa]